MLKEFNECGEENKYGINSWNNLYLTYVGIIKERILHGEEVSDELKKEIDEFYSMNLVSITAVKQYTDELVDKDNEELPGFRPDDFVSEEALKKYYIEADIRSLKHAISRFFVTDFENKFHPKKEKTDDQRG